MIAWYTASSIATNSTRRFLVPTATCVRNIAADAVTPGNRVGSRAAGSEPTWALTRYGAPTSCHEAASLARSR
jgi:hypothetical protein